MSDTLTNSGPLETGAIPAKENSENNKASHSDIPARGLPDVPTQPDQFVAQDVATKGEAEGSPSIEGSASTAEEEDTQHLRVAEEGAEDGAKNEEEDRSSIAVAGVAETSTERDAENGVKVDGEVPEMAAPVDTPPPEAGNAAGTFGNEGVQEIGRAHV